MKTYQIIIVKTDLLDDRGQEIFEDELEDFCDCNFFQLDTNSWIVKGSVESPQDVFTYISKFVHEYDILSVYGISEAYLRDPSQLH